ncbi:hypothetical protein, partial [Rhodococcus gordoniae]|uniref:hypothetical protein n=1 Tax=Rhodococcus gordoniae TaxID=223392 RepID=UPI001ADF95E8
PGRDRGFSVGSAYFRFRTVPDAVDEVQGCGLPEADTALGAGMRMPAHHMPSLWRSPTARND